MNTARDMYSNDWRDLTMVPDTYELDPSPSEFWFLHLFIYVLRNGGQHYLVLQYPSYSRRLPQNGGVRECIWSTPYIAYKVESGPNKYHQVGHIRQFFREETERHSASIAERIAYNFYHMGVSPGRLIPMDDILEFKRSTREPDKWKCYFVKRSLVTELETLGKLNVADPECIRGFEFLCIEDLNEVLEIPGDDPEKMFFRGKPLSTNVAYPFFANEIQLLCSHPIDISEQELVYSEYGLILSFDLVSFGKFYYRVHDEFRSLTESGQEIAHELLLVLSSVFRQSLDKFGYYQRVIEGDGFLATSPLRQQVGYLKPEEKVANQLDRTLRLVITVMAKVNNAITASEASFSSRCALMLDDYTYGKTGGLHSETGGHTGKALITLSRIQSVLRRWVEERGQEPTSLIYFAVLPDFYERHKEIFDQHRFACVDTYEQQEKESLIQLRILEHQP